MKNETGLKPSRSGPFSNARRRATFTALGWTSSPAPVHEDADAQALAKVRKWSRHSKRSDTILAAAAL